RFRWLLEPREYQDRERLRLALLQRVDEWKLVLRENPSQGRQVLKHVIGPIMLWLGEHRDLEIAAGADPRCSNSRIRTTRRRIGPSAARPFAAQRSLAYSTDS